MNDIRREVILVPTDFTPVADCAIDHALEIAKLFNHKVCLLHIISKKSSAEDKRSAVEHISKTASSNSQKTGIEVFTRVEEGSIFDKISETADDVNAEFIVMGIHGRKGLQHLVGSYFYKVICSSKVPVMVVKKKHHHLGYNNIVLPVDFTYNSGEKINQAIQFAKYFDSVIHIIGVINPGSSINKINKEVLLKKVTDYIDQFKVKVKAEIIIKSGSDIESEVLEYSKKVDADLIMIVAQKDGKFNEALGQNDAEKIIDRSETPVLTILPSEGIEPDETMFASFIDPFGLIEKDVDKDK